MQHRMQGQIVFPAGGYISAVLEAVAQLIPINSVQLLEFNDVTISKALFLSETSGTETMLSLRIIRNTHQQWDLRFSFYFDGKNDSCTLIENANGDIRISLGTPSDDSLPPRHLLIHQIGIS